MEKDDNFWIEFKEIIEISEPIDKGIIKDKMFRMLNKYGKYIIKKLNS